MPSSSCRPGSAATAAALTALSACYLLTTVTAQEDWRKLVYQETVDRLEDLGQVTDGGGNLERLFLSPAHKRAAAKLEGWMQEAGLHTFKDGVANVRGRVHGHSPKQPAWLMGSHYDTVIDGGRYDGAFGIVAAIAAVKALLIEAAVDKGLISMSDALAIAKGKQTLARLVDGDVDSLLPAPLEVIAFSEEEGLRFQSTFLASSAVSGRLASSGLLDAQDASGRSLMEVLQQEGLSTSPEDVSQSSLKPSEVAGYVEVHMEQGPVLETLGQPLGVVTAIAGQSRLAVTIEGMQGHAGTVPMALRRDPMVGAAEAIQRVESICNGGPGQKDRPASEPAGSDTSLVCTVGSITVWPGSSNVIPGHVNFSIDIRSQDDLVRGKVIEAVEQDVSALCSQRSLECAVEIRTQVKAVPCDADIVNQLAAASASVQGTSSSKLAAEHLISGKVPRLVSGAGHDAMAMAHITKMGMLFVRCAGGISHSPLEHVADQDVITAVTALHAFLKTVLNRSAMRSGHEEL